MLENLGVDSLFDRQTILNYVDKGFKTFQIHFNSEDGLDLASDTYAVVSEKYLKLWRGLPPELTFVVHGPRELNLGRGDSSTASSIYQISMHLALCRKMGIKKYVVHPGDALKAEYTESFLGVWEESCKKLIPRLEAAGVQLCLENSPGSRSGKVMGSVKQIVDIVNKIGSPNIGFCFDTSHAFADGNEDFKAWSDSSLSGDFPQGFMDFLKDVSMVHLNPNLAGLKFGGHKEAHGFAMLRECIGINPKLLMDIPYRYYGPCVLERCGSAYAVTDREDILQVGTKK